MSTAKDQYLSSGKMTRRTMNTSTLTRSSSSSVIIVFLAVSAALAALKAMDRDHCQHRERAYSYTYDSRSDKARSRRTRSRSRSQVSRRKTEYDTRRSRRASVLPSSYSEVNLDVYEEQPQRYITDGHNASRSRRPSLTWNDDDRTLVNDLDAGSDRRVVLYRDESGRNRGTGHREYVHRERYEKRRT